MRVLDVVNGNTQPIFMPSGEDSEVVTTGNQSTVLSSDYNTIVIISAVGDTYIKVGEDPTASASDIFLAEGEKLPLRIAKGFKISTFGGTININK